MSVRVLLVEDDADTAEVIRLTLEEEEFRVHHCGDGLAGLHWARQQQPEIVIADINLPGLDGLSLCREIRKFSEVPLLLLSSRRQDVDKIVGLEIGADDYLTKPFNPRELLARVRTIQRRLRLASLAAAPPQGAERLRVGKLEIDLTSRELLVAGQPVHLTTSEFELLVAMASRPNRALSRDQWCELVWGSNWEGDGRSMDVHLRRLRGKIADRDQHEYFQAVRGFGYKFSPPE